ncbi:hypothetical protein [Azospirillum lipoferum]|uniref:Uncharacterized protein n=1 Tax=Azospirillum lipoferum (strain 4B) TaxID=862719 RepID=G7ZIQ9_AZOL4|nr:hypothetical protein [Azospirillum lipoferum]CBS91574.1 exported protein of unknown function [Azospirillum lipoferum 4B]
MSQIPQLLRLLLLLLTPMWLSLAVEGLGLHESLMSGLRRTPPVDSTLAPPTGWRERGYLAANPDVAAAVRTGQISSGYAHYVQHGRAEGRPGGFAEPGREDAAKAVPHAKPAAQPAVLPPKQPAAPPSPAIPIPAAPVPAVKPDPRDDAAPARTEPAVEVLRPAVKPVPDSSAQPVRFQPAAPSGPQRPESQRHVERIRTANGGDGLRVVLDLDQDPRYETPVRRPDGRLEVRLPGTLWQAAPSGRLPATALGYRAERDGSGTRLLFSDDDGTGEDGPVRLLAVSTLPPDKDRGHRLVIDVALPSMAKADRARTPGGR